MKRQALAILLFFSPFLSFAQQEGPVVKEFYKSTRNIPATFVFNDQENIMTVNNDSENFDVIAVNDEMQQIWKTSLKGYIHVVKKLNDKILAIASTDFSSAKRYNNTFKGFLIDPASGKVLLEKVLYDGQQDYLTSPYFFTGEGNFLKLAIRTTTIERRMHVAMPGMLSVISFNGYYKQYHQTTSLDVLDFNEKLEPVYKFKAAVPADETFLGMASNNQGDLFVNWFGKDKIDFVKYDAGKDKPLKSISGSIVLDDDILKNLAEDMIDLAPSKKNSNVLYYSIAFRNPDKERELGIGKIDFSTGKNDYANEVFTKSHVKDIKKDFVPLNKKLGSPDLGGIKELGVRKLMEVDDHVIVILSSFSSQSSTIGSGQWIIESNLLLNDYDSNLHLRSQQLIPSEYSVPNMPLPVGYYHKDNKLYVITNDKHGFTTLNAFVCIYNLSSNKFESMNWIPKKKIGSSEIAATSSVMWFKDSFLMPYLDVHMMSGKFEVNLQKNSY
ncbi:MAG TPA: hypothetical protein VIM89_08855 [Mucilaginibacter sp.]